MMLIAVVAAYAAALAAAGFSGCFDEIVIGDACDLAPCDTPGWCSEPNAIINKTVYTTTSPGERKKKNNTDALCFKTFYVWGDENYRNALSFCESVTNGHRVHGGLCRQPGPF